MRALGFLMVGLIALFSFSLGSAWYVKISREDLLIDKSFEASCTPPLIPSFWRDINGYPNYNLDLIANYFGVFAAYALNAYEPDENERFNLDPKVFGWSPVAAPIKTIGGFFGQVFIKEAPDRVFVMFVFRGTDGITSIVDNLSNASWFTQMLNPWDQYRTARKLVADQVGYLDKRFPNKKLSFLAVGHSLGGGLARHIATAFPCFAAITFNSSFVSNNFRLSAPFKPQIIDVFEKEDPLSRVALKLKPEFFFSINSGHQWYRVRNVAEMDGQHGIFRAAAAMARIPVVCIKTDKWCQVSDVVTLKGYDDLGHRADVRGVQRLLCDAAPPTVRNEPELCK